MAKKKAPPARKTRQERAERKTPRRDLFVAEYLVDLNATQAAIRCGYSPKTAGSQGDRLLKDVEISAAVAKALEERKKRVGVKADDVVARWDRRARSTAADFLKFETVRHRPKVWVTATEAARRLSIELAIEESVLKRGGGADVETSDLKSQRMKVADIRRDLLRMEARAKVDPGYMVEVDGEMVEEVRATFDLVRLRDADRLDLVKSVKVERDGSCLVVMHDAAQADEALGKHLGLFVTKHEHTGKEGGPIETLDRSDPKSDLAARIAAIVARSAAPAPAGE